MIRITEERRVSGVTNSKIVADMEINDKAELAATLATVREELDAWEDSRVRAEQYRQTQVAVEQVIFEAETEEPSPETLVQLDVLLRRLPEDEAESFRQRLTAAAALRQERASRNQRQPRTFGRRGSVEF